MTSLAPGLLVAAPPLEDPNFDRSVVLLASHGEGGAFGWIVNGRQVMSLSELVSQTGMKCSPRDCNGNVYFGGPVGERQVWLLYKTEERPAAVDDQFDLGMGITASPSQRVLRTVAEGTAPASIRGVLGFAGWEPSQLEEEIARGAWLPTNAEASLVFDVSLEEMWTRAYQQAGTSPIAFTSRIVGQA